MKSTEQIVVLRLTTEINLSNIETMEITPRIAARYNRLRQIHAATSVILNSRLDGVFEVVR